jgi:hypothetical protein
MLSNGDSVSEFHLRLRIIADYKPPIYFWVVVISAFLAIVIPCYVYSRCVGNLAIPGTFSAFNGIVMHVIFSR